MARPVVLLGPLLALLAIPAQASDKRTWVDIPAVGLQSAISVLAKLTGAEILYDKARIRGLRSHPIHGTLSVADALTQLLEGTDLTSELTPDGTFILIHRPQVAVRAPVDTAIPDILVIGSRTQDVDIRRTENDIQPYQVVTVLDLERGHQDNLDDYLRTRLTTNAQYGSAIQTGASSRSEINLLGLGPNRTLVLVDGRRMPSFPAASAFFGQPDINGIPPNAVARIEALTGTASGIYGPGAIGGVVNVVLRHDYHGLELHVSSGIADDGDARRLRVEMLAGTSLSDDRISLSAGFMQTLEQPLFVSHQSIVSRSRALDFANTPDSFDNFSPGNAINVISLSGNLILKPQYGGQVLGSGLTYLPLGFSGSDAQRTSLLIANAGKLNTDVPTYPGVANSYLNLSNRQTTGLFNIRAELTDRLTLYVDALGSLSNGRYEDAQPSTINLALGSQLYNPFQNAILFTFPISGTAASDVNTRSGRTTAGIVARIGASWSATADVSLGASRIAVKPEGSSPSAALYQLFLPTGANAFEPPLNPFGNYNAFLAGLQAYLMPIDAAATVSTDRFWDASARVAGPVTRLPAGQVMLTVLGEIVDEKLPPENLTQTPGAIDAAHRRTESVYGELRAPIIGERTRFAPIRRLELQFAARFDRVAQDYPSIVQHNFDLPDVQTGGRDIKGSLTFTAGILTRPTARFILRGSISTGTLPPTVQQLTSIHSLFDNPDFAALSDPRRAGEMVGTKGPYEAITGGSPAIRSELSRTFALGFILNPNGDGPRLSIDYSRIHISRGIDTNFAGAPQFFLDNQGPFSTRVRRAALTADDIARGYSAGRITSIDATALNGTTTDIDALDATIGWHLRLGGRDSLAVFGSTTWHPRYRQRDPLIGASTDFVDYTNGVLRLRASGGVEWTRERSSVGMDVQWYSRYQVGSAGVNAGTLNASAAILQGSTTIPAQGYVDVFASRDVPLAGGLSGKRLSVRIGIENILNRVPPIVASSSPPGYSLYGDPRGRRVELTLSIQK